MASGSNLSYHSSSFYSCMISIQRLFSMGTPCFPYIILLEEPIAFVSVVCIKKYVLTLSTLFPYVTFIGELPGFQSFQ